jgi:hypothetical protein
MLEAGTDRNYSKTEEREDGNKLNEKGPNDGLL